MLDSFSSKYIENAVMQVLRVIKKQEAARKWHNLSEYNCWYELVACILGSNVKFEYAQSFASFLNTHGALNINNINCNYDNLEIMLVDYLSKPLSVSSDNESKIIKYSYPKLRANHIRRTAELIYGRGNTLKSLLEVCKSASEARYQLTLNSIGIGPKQASLFLRNIGFSNNLAILDVHVLRYMDLLNILSGPVKSISNLTKYERIEQILHLYAMSIRAKLSQLDVAIWVVMRVYQKEFAY